MNEMTESVRSAAITRAIPKIVNALSRIELEAVLILLDDGGDELFYEALCVLYQERFPKSAMRFFGGLDALHTMRKQEVIDAEHAPGNPGQ